MLAIMASGPSGLILLKAYKIFLNDFLIVGILMHNIVLFNPGFNHICDLLVQIIVRL